MAAVGIDVLYYTIFNYFSKNVSYFLLVVLYIFQLEWYDGAKPAAYFYIFTL